MKTNINGNGNTAGEGIMKELVESLASKDGMIRKRAREKLLSFGKPTVEMLVTALNDHRDQVRWEAAKALVDLPDQQAAAALVKRLEDEEFDIRWLAAEALVALQEEALPALLGALEKHPDKIRLREGAHHVFKKLKNKRTYVILRPLVAALDKMDPELTVPVAVKNVMKLLQKEQSIQNH